MGPYFSYLNFTYHLPQCEHYKVEEVKRSYQQLSKDVSGLILLLLKHASLLKTKINWGDYIDQLCERRKGSKGNKIEGSCMGRQLDKRNKNIEQK